MNIQVVIGAGLIFALLYLVGISDNFSDVERGTYSLGTIENIKNDCKVVGYDITGRTIMSVTYFCDDTSTYYSFSEEI